MSTTTLSEVAEPHAFSFHRHVSRTAILCLAFGLTVSDRAILAAADTAEPLAPTGSESQAVAQEEAVPWQAKQAVINLHHTFHLYEALRKLDNVELNGQPYVGVCHKGDSMAGIPSWIMRCLAEQHGLGGFVSPNLGFTWNGFAWTYTGAAHQGNSREYRGLVASYQWFSGANQIVMPDGSTATALIPTQKPLFSSASAAQALVAPDCLGAHGQPKTIRFIYLKTPGGGELTFSLSQDRETYSAVVVDTDAAERLDYRDIDVKNLAGAINVEVSSAKAESIFLGFVAYYDSGVIVWRSGVGGTPMQLWANSYVDGKLSQPDQDLFKLLNTRGVFYLQRAADADDPARRFKEYLDAMSVIPASHIHLGEPPIDEASNETITRLNAILRKECETRRLPFIDLLMLAGGDSAVFDELGWNDPDATHLTIGAHRTIGSMIYGVLDRFHTGFGRDTFHNLTPRRFDELRVRSALLDAFGCDRTFDAGSSLSNPQTTGDATQTATHERGIHLGLDAGRSGSIGGNVCNHGQGASLRLADTRIVSMVGVFYRGIILAGNARATLFFGSGSPPPTKPEGLTAAGWGLQFGNAAGEGVPEISGVAVRLFYHDGTTLTYLPWAPTVADSGGIDTTASAFGLEWDRETNRVKVLAGRAESFMKVAYETRMPADWGTKTLGGQWVSASLYDTGAPVADKSDFRLLRVMVRSSALDNRRLYPFGGAR